MKVYTGETLYGRLALRQQMINSAVGVRGITPQVQHLLNGYNDKRKNVITDVMKAAFLQGQIQQAKKEVAKLSQQIEQEPDIEKQRSMLAQAMQLQRVANNAIEQLQKIEKRQATQDGVTNRANGNQDQRPPNGQRATANRE